MHASRIALVATAALGLTACFTGHAAIGPHVRHAGGAGATLAGSVGVGASVGDYKLIAMGATLMAVVDDFGRAGGGVNVDYVDAGLAVPMRVTLRAGSLVRVRQTDADGNLDPNSYPTRGFVGAAIAFYPFHNDVRAPHDDDASSSSSSTRRSGQSDDDMLSGLDDMFSHHHGDSDDGKAVLAGLGLELAVDALPSSAPDDPRELYVSLSLVGEVGVMPRPTP